jgi:hypothetical protein
MAKVLQFEETMYVWRCFLCWAKKFANGSCLPYIYYKNSTNFTYCGMVKPLRGWAWWHTWHDAQRQGHSITSRFGVVDSMIFHISCAIDTTWSLLLQVYDHHWKIMSYNVLKKMTLKSIWPIMLIHSQSSGDDHTFVIGWWWLWITLAIIVTKMWTIWTWFLWKIVESATLHLNGMEWCRPCPLCATEWSSPCPLCWVRRLSCPNAPDRSRARARGAP